MFEIFPTGVDMGYMITARDWKGVGTFVELRSAKSAQKVRLFPIPLFKERLFPIALLVLWYLFLIVSVNGLILVANEGDIYQVIAR